MNAVLDIRYWTLLTDVIHAHNRIADASNPRPLKVWLGAILVRVPIVHIVLSFLNLYARRDDLSKAVSACLVALWPIGVQKTTTETLLECFCASLPVIQAHDADEGLATVASLAVNSYRNSLANNSSKKKVCRRAFQLLLPDKDISFAACSCNIILHTG